jgi:hypothetical protein
MFHASACGVARLSIDTSGDLFEMDASIAMEVVFDFKTRRKEWAQTFDRTLRGLFESRIAGKRRKGRRPDAEQSLQSLRVLSDADTRKQDALGALTHRFKTAAKDELDALDYRVSTLLGEPPSLEVDNPFAPVYLLDAIGMTSRALYRDPQVWRSVMVRVVTDFIPAIAKIYIPINRLLAERGVLPEIGAILRARSSLHPSDDAQVLPLFDRLINEIHPSLQAWRTLDARAATEARYNLLPLAANPFALALKAGATGDAATPDCDPADFPRLDAMMSRREVFPVLEMLDRWQRSDPMAEHLRDHAPAGLDASVTPVNRIPWIQAAIGAKLPDARERNTIDVVGFMFDYIIRDIAIPPRLRLMFDGLQVPLLKVALSDPGLFTAKRHPARLLINELAEAAVGADDDPNYRNAITKVASRAVETIRADFGIDTRVFESAREPLRALADRARDDVLRAMQPHIDAALAEEVRDADRAQVRALVRNRLAGADVAFDVRAFSCTVWASYLKQLRQTDGPESTAYGAAAQTLDDLLWSITVKARSGQRSRLSRMIPSLVRRLRDGGAAVQVTGEKMKRFLDTLYELHVAAIRPDDARASSIYAGEPVPAAGGAGPMRNTYDLVIDAVVGTWYAIERDDGRWIHARLDWISPARTTYILNGRAAGDTFVVSPEDLAWDIMRRKAALVTEPVPLYDRAISAALDFLSERRARPDDATASPARTGAVRADARPAAAIA